MFLVINHVLFLFMKIWNERSVILSFHESQQFAVDKLRHHYKEFWAWLCSPYKTPSSNRSRVFYCNFDKPSEKITSAESLCKRSRGRSNYALDFHNLTNFKKLLPAKQHQKQNCLFLTRHSLELKRFLSFNAWISEPLIHMYLHDRPQQPIVFLVFILSRLIKTESPYSYKHFLDQ